MQYFAVILVVLVMILILFAKKLMLWN